MRSITALGLEVALDALTDLDADELSVVELQRALEDLSPQIGRLLGAQTRLVGALLACSGGTVPAEDRDVLVRHWLRDLTNSGGSAAGAQVRLATALRTLPLLEQAVVDGRVQPAQAAVVTRLVGRIDPTALAEAEPALVHVAAHRDPQSLADYVRHLEATWCEPQLEADARTQENKRYLQTRREADGMLSGRFRLTSADSESFLTLLEPLARSTGLQDTRDAGQRRADALIEVFGLSLRFADLPDAGGHRPQVSYVVPAGWAAGDRATGSFADLVRASPPSESGAVPVELRCATGAWSGPQTRTHIEAVLCDARITRVLLCERGQVRRLEALRDSITPTQRRALAARDLGCVVRGCTRPPAFCDAHHLTHREDGGETTLDNLVLLCRRHHVLWHQGRLLLRDLHVPWRDQTSDPPAVHELTPVVGHRVQARPRPPGA